jgi:hypothetical protein
MQRCSQILGRSISVILLILAYLTLLSFVTVRVGIVLMLSIDMFKHVIALLAVLLVASTHHFALRLGSFCAY